MTVGRRTGVAGRDAVRVSVIGGSGTRRDRRTLACDGCWSRGATHRPPRSRPRRARSGAWREDIAAFAAELPVSAGRHARRRRTRRVRPRRRGRRWCAGSGSSSQRELGRAPRGRGRRRRAAGSAARPHCCRCGKCAARARPSWTCRTMSPPTDVRLAHREGYEHVEHMKRYTTHGMATDQGRIGGLLGSAILAQARGVVGRRRSVCRSRGPTRSRCRSPRWPAPRCAQHYKPKRRLPLHEWHEAAGATFVSTGLWLRPLVYARQRRLGCGARGGARRARAASGSPTSPRSARSTCRVRMPRPSSTSSTPTPSRRCAVGPRALRDHAARGRHAVR